MTIEEFYNNIGEDYYYMENVHKHEKIILRYLELFYNDDTLYSLRYFLNNQNFKDAYRMAHALRGMSLNIGFFKFCSLSQELTDILKPQIYDDRIKGLLGAIEDEYYKIKRELTALFNSRTSR